MKNLKKQIIFYACIVLAFLVLAYGFVPQVLTGKIVNQSDISGYVGMAHETNEWNAAHPDDRTAWTNSMFGGMPTTMLTGNSEGDWTQNLYDLFLTGRRPASYLFISLLGAFLMMLAFGIHPLIAVGGAIAVTFCSYNLQIIQVGHNAKMVALAFAPWVLAGVLHTYRTAFKDGKWLAGTVFGATLFAMALNFQIKANHVQISYYLAIIIFSYVAVLAVWLFSDKERRAKAGRFFAASALLLVLGCAGIATNANRLIPTYNYTKETMRGGSQLQAEGDKAKSKGLDLEYATSWSYGWEELPNMLIPNFNGGSSAAAVNPDKSETAQLLKRAGQSNYRQVAKALPMYWGPQPFTAGPMYMGAITVFLFILGLCLYKGKEKWWILIPTIIGIGLALGNHFMPFTEFWYYHIPFYSKFRTVSMALVILQFTLPLLGFLVLDRIVKNGYSKEEFLKKGGIAFALTGGFCLLCWLFPGIAGTFTSPSDARQPEILAEAFAADRIMLLRNDALISFFLIAATFVILIWAYSTPKKEKTVNGRRIEAGIAVCALVLVNLLVVGKRYLNSEHFVTPKQFDNQFTARPVDNMILEDKELDYRVLDMSVNVFNDSYPSYFHKNIGGYSPVKLQRYQDLIDRHISKEINSIYASFKDISTVQEAMDSLPYLPVLSMLNSKYIIIAGDSAPVRNRYAMGSCWFVDNAVAAGTPEEEISLLGQVDIEGEAVVGADFAWAVSAINSLAPADSSDYIVQTYYAPNELRYKYKAVSDRAAVFSEIYYPNGWTLKVDGKDVDIFRANWTLRGAVLPAGEHEVVMRFEPSSYVIGTRVSRASSILLLLLTLLSLGGMFYKKH